MGARTGLTGKLYRATAGSAATTEVPEVGDVELVIKTTTAKVNRRVALETFVVSRYNVQINMTCPDDESTNVEAIKTAARTRAKIALKVLNKASGKGFEYDFYVSEDTETQPLDDVIGQRFVAVPADDATLTTGWVT